MRRYSTFVSIVAILMGCMAAYLARDWLKETQVRAVQEAQARAVQEAQARAAQETRPKPAAEVTRTIVVAAVPLQFGTKITEDKIVEIRWAAERLPTGAFSTRQELLKDGPRVALGAIQKDEPVLRFKVNAPGQRGGSLSTLLDEGMRAVSVPIDNSGGVAGLIQPDDHVDVVLVRTEGAANGRSYSDLIFQNVKVLAVDQTVGQQVEQPTNNVKVVTLVVTPEEAQKLVLATSVGRMSLILRQRDETGPRRDETGASGRRFTAGDLASVLEPKEEVSAVAPAADTSTVTILRGGRQDIYTVKRY